MSGCVRIYVLPSCDLALASRFWLSAKPSCVCFDAFILFLSFECSVTLTVVLTGAWRGRGALSGGLAEIWRGHGGVMAGAQGFTGALARARDISGVLL